MVGRALPCNAVNPSLPVQVISGNVNTNEVVLKDLGPPIIARYIRFYPRADRVMSVCLRVELYGCLWRGECPLIHPSPPALSCAWGCISTFGGVRS